MEEIAKKKRRIARIGGMSSGKEGTKSQIDDGAIQTDCNLVYDIMQSMNKSQNVLSYQQYQDFRSKDMASRTNYTNQSSSNKQNGKAFNSKQIKKFVPEKTFPLMEKCQRSMKYLKKNRCIPKPRAHVGFIPRPSPNPVPTFQPHSVRTDHSVSNNTVIFKEKPKKTKCSPEMNIRPKKLKESHSNDTSCNSIAFQKESKSIAFQKESSDKESKFASATDTDSDNDFEKFLQKHHPKKSVRRKTDKSNKFKRKKPKDLMCTKKFDKVTTKTLSTSEESGDSEVECNTFAENNIERKIDTELPTKSFHRITEYESSNDSSTDAQINDFGTLNYDSSSSSEDENEPLINKIVTELNRSQQSNTLPTELRPDVSSASSSNTPDSLNYNALKLKAKVPCKVILKRDPLLDEKAASLKCNNPVKTNSLTDSNPDEDDCIIIDMSPNNYTNQNSKTITLSIENGVSIQGQSTITSNSPCVSETVNNKRCESILNQDSLCNSNRLAPKTVANFNEKSDKNLFARESMNVDSAECGDKIEESFVSLNTDSTDISSEKNEFNVQIISVKSLNESDVIVLSDDNEEKEIEPVNTINETKESGAEDSDVEIICLDSSIVKEEKSMKENLEVNLNNEARSKVSGEIKEHLISSSTHPLESIEDDCVVLDDLELQSESTGLAKSSVNLQQSSQIAGTISNDKTTLVNDLDSSKNTILKILDTIDFNCINKVIKETTTPEPQIENTQVKVENSLCDSIETSGRASNASEKLTQSQNVDSLSQNSASINLNITPVVPGVVNVDIKTLNCTADNTSGSHPEFLSAKNVSENVPSSIKLKRKLSSSESVRGSTVCNDSNSNATASKSVASEKEVLVSSCKSVSNALLHPPKNPPLLPVCTKVESYESPSDELDVIAAKSIQNLNDKKIESIVPLLELYRSEYKRFMQIKSTEHNVSAGLKLLEEQQAKRLLAISSSIKNIVKKDECFHKINNEFKSNHSETKSLKNDFLNKDGSLVEMKQPSAFLTEPSCSNHPNVEEDDKNRIFNQPVVDEAAKVINSAGSSSSKEVYKHLINVVCAECGKHAVAACSGCAKVYYCSEKCGMTNWSKGHFATCGK